MAPPVSRWQVEQEQRRADRIERRSQETEGKPCEVCGEVDPRCLLTVQPSSSRPTSSKPAGSSSGVRRVLCFNHHAKETRHERAPDGRSCWRCGESDPRAIEMHHPAGRANADFVIPLCRNHHALASDLQQSWPYGLLAPTSRDPRNALQAVFWGVSDLITLRPAYGRLLVRLLTRNLRTLVFLLFVGYLIFSPSQKSPGTEEGSRPKESTSAEAGERDEDE